MLFGFVKSAAISLLLLLLLLLLLSSSLFFSLLSLGGNKDTVAKGVSLEYTILRTV